MSNNASLSLLLLCQHCISIYTQVVFKYIHYYCSVCILVTIIEFFSYWIHKCLRLVPKVMLQKLFKHMLSSILIHKLCTIFGEVCEEPGKCCLHKWYIENFNDYVTLMLCVGLALDSKKHAISYHLLILLQHKHQSNRG